MRYKVIHDIEEMNEIHKLGKGCFFGPPVLPVFPLPQILNVSAADKTTGKSLIPAICCGEQCRSDSTISSGKCAACVAIL